jgi:hypothetical protein
MPAAWMISSNAQEETIDYFLNTICMQNPNIIPKRFMSDKDRGQMNTIQQCYPESQLLLRWWHVLHAWQQHFITSHYPELWDLLKKWIRLTDKSEFDNHWAKIKQLSPTSFEEYLTTYWLNEPELWSAVYRKIGQSLRFRTQTCLSKRMSFFPPILF